MWDDYGQQPETINYITRNKYAHARLRFYEFQSGIFAFIDPRCRSPPPSFRFQQTRKSKGWYNHENNKPKNLLCSHNGGHIH